MFERKIRTRANSGGQSREGIRPLRFFRDFRDSLLLLGAAVLFTTAVLVIAGAPPFDAYFHIFKGAAGSVTKFAHVLAAWVPLALCACGLLYTFRIGLWNIGIEGQVMMGAVFATFALRLGTNGGPPAFFIFLAFVAGALGGGLWALIAGYLKTKGGVNEIFAGLGMNYVAQGVVLWLIFGPWKRPGVASMSGTELFPTELWLPNLSSLRISPVSLALPVIGVGLTAILLRYSKIGLNLRAIGSNPGAAYLFGLKPSRYMLLAMMFAGGFAGLAGSVQVAGVYHRLIPAISSNYGYLALLVVMLAGYNIWASVAVALFFAGVNVGSIQLPMMLRQDSSLAGVIQGALVLAALAAQYWRSRKVSEKAA